MTDLEDFEDALERELLGVARRLNQPEIKARRFRIRPLVLAAMLLVAGAAIGGAGWPLLFGADAVSAEALVVTELADRTEIRVVDLVADAGAEAGRLSEQLGMSVEVLAVPVVPQLIGQVTSVVNTGPIEVETRVNNAGVIDLVTLPIGFSGTLTLAYGRQASPGEPYVESRTDRLCAQLFGLTAVEASTILGNTNSEILVETMSDGGVPKLTPGLNTVPAQYYLVDIQAMSDRIYLVTFADTLDALPVHPNCL